jgi:hypothetical protein
MTEAEWFTGDEPLQMLAFLRQSLKAPRTKKGRKRLHLFAVACCRRVVHALPKRGRQFTEAALEVKERLVEERATRKEYERAWNKALNALAHLLPWVSASGDEAQRGAAAAASAALRYDAYPAAYHASHSVAALAGAGQDESVGHKATPEMQAHARLLRCLFGNPFHPLALDVAFTPDLISLAHAANEERVLPLGELDRERLTVLADALEDAGAGDEVVAHLRGPGPHLRGCWVVDLVLGKE